MSTPVMQFDEAMTKGNARIVVLGEEMAEHLKSAEALEAQARSERAEYSKKKAERETLVKTIQSQLVVNQTQLALDAATQAQTEADAAHKSAQERLANIDKRAAEMEAQHASRMAQLDAKIAELTKLPGTEKSE